MDNRHENTEKDDEDTAKHKLELAGFDPGDPVSAVDPPPEKKPVEVGSWYSITPMTYFCYHGDLPMCRYILDNGGFVIKTGREWWFPMYAAVNRGHLEICRWLFENGAHKDVLTPTWSGGYRPLATCWRSPCGGTGLFVCKWLLLHGAGGPDGQVKQTILQKDLRPAKRQEDNVWIDHRPAVLSWSQGAIQDRASFQTFLMGTFVPADEQNGDAPPRDTDDTKSSVQCVNGNEGVLRCIADFVGVTRDAKELQIHRRLVEVLPLLLEENPSPLCLGRKG